MGEFKEEIRLSVVNADMSVERQNALRLHLSEQLAEINNQTTTEEYNLTFIGNQDNRPISRVLVANPKADIVLSGFNVTRKFQDRSTKAVDNAMVDDSTGSDLQIDPTIRFQAYRELLSIITRDSFRLRRIFFVGNINERIRELLKYRFEISATFYEDAQRGKVSAKQYITLDKLPIPGGQPEGGQYDLAQISQLFIGELAFEGVIHMSEEGGQFFFPDATIDASIQKMLALDEAKEEFLEEVQEEEKSLFVRKKRVMLVLNPDLLKIVSSKLRFDQMEEVFEYSDTQTAIDSMSVGQTTDIATHLEIHGYDQLTSILSPGERDILMVGLMGPRLLPSIITKECKTMGGFAKNISPKKVTEILHEFSENFLNRLLIKLQDKSMSSFLSRIKPEIREPLIVEFLKDKNFSVGGFKTFTTKEQNDFFLANTSKVLASLLLVDTPLFKKKLPDVSTAKAGAYNSVSDFAALSEQEVQFRIGTYAEDYSNLKWPKEKFEEMFNEGELAKVIASYLLVNSQAFFNTLDAVKRKNLWFKIGEEGKREIVKKLHHQDKLTLLEGAAELAMDLLVKDAPFLGEQVKREKEESAAAMLLIALKQFNKIESKTGLLKRLSNDPKLKEHRMERITLLMSSPEGKSIYQKLTLEVESLKAGYDGLVCLRKDIEALQAQEELANAKLTIVDDLVDASLLEMFASGKVDVNSYEKEQAKIQAKLNDLMQKMKSSGQNDPVGAYLIESMIIMMKMTGQAMQNKLDSSMIQTLDERSRLKNTVIADVANRVENLAAQVSQAEESLPALEQKASKLKEHLSRQEELVGERLGALQNRMGQMDQVKGQLKKANAQKVKVAKIQQVLSKRFFELIRPLILDKLSMLPAPVAKMFSSLKQRFGQTEELQSRAIFKFTDDELEKIAKRNIVFCTENAFLRRFIVTCLKIDRLDDTLFHIAGKHDIPDEPDLLFVGADLENEDFSEYIDDKYKIIFADEAFYQSLMVNEKNKGIIRQSIQKNDLNFKKLKEFLEEQGGKLKKMAGTKHNFQQQVSLLQKQKKELAQTTKKNQENLAFLEVEQKSLQEKFTEIDTKFQSAKTSIEEAVASGDGALDSIAEGSKELSGTLSDTLMSINKEMAGLMFLKNVGDTAETISKTTQNGIAQKMTDHTRIEGGKHFVQSLVVAHEGSLSSGDLSRTINVCAGKYFGQTIDSKNVQIGRMESEIIDHGQRPNLVCIVTTDEAGDLSSQKELVKKLKIQAPATNLVVFAPYSIDESTPVLAENMNGIRNFAMLVNTALVDYTNESKIIKLFTEIAPE